MIAVPNRVRGPVFSGSYDPEDVVFLLTPLASGNVLSIGPADKEALITSGTRHYSEMLTWEEPPSLEYRYLFLDAVRRHAPRLAAEVGGLAAALDRQLPGPITLVSLARAGTPVGVLLHRLLSRRFGRDSAHYSISIVRDRGIDEAALGHILQERGRPVNGVVFVDGWTAKGTIARELDRAIQHWNAKQPPRLALVRRLVVVSDIGGVADLAATREDYAIPSGILNATVSGLVSRSLLPADLPPDAFHGCLRYEHLVEHDLSRWFIDAVLEQVPDQLPEIVADPDGARAQRGRIEALVSSILALHPQCDVNRIKPGVAEATRALLRRAPEALYIGSTDDADIAHLLWLAEQLGTPVRTMCGMPVKAVAVVSTHGPRAE